MRSGHQAKNTSSGAIVIRLLAAAVTMTSFLSSAAWGQKAPTTPNEPWLPDHRTLERHTIAVPPHEVQIDGEHVYSLGELIDIAESNSPATQAAWNRAKMNAASVGIAKSELYPTIIAAVSGTNYLNPQLFYRTFVLQDWAIFDIDVHLAYTLVDFGARHTEISAAQARLVAANLSFNNEHLELIRQVSQAYFSLLRARGLREAAEVSLKDAQTSEAAAQERRNNGLATVPEVLEAKAATAKALYDLKSAIGAEQVEIGNLARAITANPVKPLKVEPLDQLRIPDKLDQSVEDAINTAFKDRPDLQADQARVSAAQAEVKHAHTSYYPSLTFEGSKGWIRGFGEQYGYPGTYAHTPTYAATLALKWTVFDGFRRENSIRQAKAGEKTAMEEIRDRQDEITNQVWNDYSDAATALEQRQAAAALLSASSEAYSAALESYKDGVRNFLDVLAAEDALAQARAIDVTARTQVLQTFSDLEFRTGDLLANHPKGKNP
ncbi:TolC family protein [Alloacidobacterium dinghuense]|uniref:TolC family protein n=1 Tax=Alloacidobacterium dinghuense TaxID=2763107 RepID=A0A7G8BD75_9BACT|nr:TolC family protein [Alloacidobacterium dinghuense]QNI30495.1 TolC family protein [Alloacidobacterium dinghuense]